MDTPAPAPEPVPAAEPVFVEPASFFVRAGAMMIDSVILMLAAFVPLPGIPILIGLAYKTIFLSQGGQTPGKMAAGIKVIRADGEALSVGRALGRAFGEYLSALLLGMGYAVALFGEKRALHDYVAGTRVINLEGVAKGRRVAVGLLGVFLPLLVVVGIGAAVLIPSMGRFRDLSQRSSEGATKGWLGSLRSATAIYYGDLEGNYPSALEQLVPKYIKEIPQTKLKDHAPSNAVTIYGPEVCTGRKEYGQDIDASKLKDTGGWGYVADPKAACYGQVFVDCTHKDAKGKGWTEY